MTDKELITLAAKAAGVSYQGTGYFRIVDERCIRRHSSRHCAGRSRIGGKVMSPTPDQIKIARHQSGLSQTAAANLIHSTMRTWQDWEAGKARMHAGLWELFLLKIG